ncbi:hypothetical protein PIB30_019553 [Stylosanthes scabra]|uniref:Uncharacterized protein n=1 Tax=Stylosanthes scabra TaxID=79078 RepID=A0ABU6X8Z9_9FABA|nr:hypothetical protein [Stylosanthes scabra]
MRVLDIFRKASGMKVNLDKSKALCSKHISNKRKEMFTGKLTMNRQFLYKGKTDGRNLNLLKWNIIVTVKKHGELSVRDACHTNHTLLGEAYPTLIFVLDTTNSLKQFRIA